MADLYDEIKEDVAAERYQALWARYGNILIAIALLIVISTGGVSWWNSYQENKIEEAGDTLFAAHVANRKGNTAEAIELYKTVLDKGSVSQGAQEIAFLRIAAIHGADNNKKAMLEAYEQAINSDKISDSVKQLAAVLYSYNVLGQEEISQYDLDKIGLVIENNLNLESSWKYSVMEIKALYEIKKGNNSKAIEILNSLKSEADAPGSLKDRATAILSEL